MGKKGKKRAREPVASSNTSNWDKFKWNPVGDDENDAEEGGSEVQGAMFFGIEELDSHSYKIEKSNNGGIKVLARSSIESKKKDQNAKKRKTDKEAKTKAKEVDNDDDSDDEHDGIVTKASEKNQKRHKSKKEEKEGRNEKNVKTTALSNLAKYTNVPPVSYSSWCNVNPRRFP